MKRVLISILLLVSLIALPTTQSGCAWFQQIGNPITMTPKQRLVQSQETYAATVTWLAQAASAGLINEADKQKIRAIRLQADAAINAADQVITEGEDASQSLKLIDQFIDQLIAERTKVEKKAK